MEPIECHGLTVASYGCEPLPPCFSVRRRVQCDRKPPSWDALATLRSTWLCISLSIMWRLIDVTAEASMHVVIWYLEGQRADSGPQELRGATLSELVHCTHSSLSCADMACSV